jgi:hypothetical protein
MLEVLFGTQEKSKVKHFQGIQYLKKKKLKSNSLGSYIIR